MTLTLRFLGVEILHVSTDSASPEPVDDTARDLSGGTTSATPIGFAGRYDDQRWESGE